MGADAWITLVVTVLTIGLLATDRYPPSLVMGGAVTFLLVVGVIDEDGALLGFANEAPVTVAALYLLAGAADITGALDALTDRAFGKGEPEEDSAAERRRLARIAAPSATASAFIANTPLVGMLAPRLVSWCRRTRRSPSRYLMPLSYVVIFGGCTTMIGTSTNLVVAGLQSEAGQEPFSLFEITPAGLPIAIVGVILTVLLGPRLLPRRQAPSDDLSARAREFTVEMMVSAKSPLAGRSVADAGLRNLEGVYLIGIEREGELREPVSPLELLQEHDRLIFAGNISRIVDLQRVVGLEGAEERHFGDLGEGSVHLFYEAVIGDGSDLAGTTLKEAGFRRRYGAAVFAVHRAGERIPGKLGEVPLRAGDVLLLVGDADFHVRWQDHPDFLVLAPLSTGEQPVRRSKAPIVQVLGLLLIGLAGTGVLGLLQASLLVAIALIAFGVMTPAEARRSIDLDIIVLMAVSFGLASAISESGLAEEIARLTVDVFGNLGDVGVLAGVLLATMLMTELLSNNAAAVLMFPIAMATAAEAGLNPEPFAAAILFGASLSFLTPIGYQTNTLVWGMGGYRYSDFSRLGAPLTLATVVMVLTVVPIVFPLS